MHDETVMSSRTKPASGRSDRATPAPNAVRNPLQQPLWFGLLALIQLLIALALATQSGQPNQLWILTAVVALSLSIDNAAIAWGARLKQRRWFPALGQLRYVLHSMITPLLLPLTVDIGAAGGAPLDHEAVAFSWLLSAIWIFVGWWVGTRNLALWLLQEGQVVFHKNNDRSGQPWLDLAYVGLVVVILVVAGLTPIAPIRTALLSGGIAMLVSQYLASRWGRSLSNLGELILLASFAIAINQISA